MLMAQALVKTNANYAAVATFDIAITIFDHLPPNQLPAPMAYIDYAFLLFSLGSKPEIVCSILNRGKSTFERYGMSQQVDMMDEAMEHIESLLLIKIIQGHIMAHLENVRSCLPVKQAELYREFGNYSRPDLQQAFYLLASEGRIERTKSGQSYLISLP